MDSRTQFRLSPIAGCVSRDFHLGFFRTYRAYISAPVLGGQITHYPQFGAGKAASVATPEVTRRHRIAPCKKVLDLLMFHLRALGVRQLQSPGGSTTVPRIPIPSGSSDNGNARTRIPGVATGERVSGLWTTPWRPASRSHRSL